MSETKDDTKRFVTDVVKRLSRNKGRNAERSRILVIVDTVLKCNKKYPFRRVVDGNVEIVTECKYGEITAEGHWNYGNSVQEIQWCSNCRKREELRKQIEV